MIACSKANSKIRKKGKESDGGWTPISPDFTPNSAEKREKGVPIAPKATWDGHLYHQTLAQIPQRRVGKGGVAHYTLMLSFDS